MVLALAGFVAVGALFPLSRWAGGALDHLPGDPIASAAYSTAAGLASPVDLARLEAAADRDPLAARGLAIHERRVGNLGRADALYQGLLADAPDDLVILNNAANVRLDLGHLESALELYARAVDLVESPVVLFNLSQAYGRSFQVEDLNRTLAHAQSVDGELVAQLTALQRTASDAFVVDLPLPTGLLWQRLLEAEPDDGLGAALRAPVAPGRLGRDPWVACGAVAAVVALASLVGLRFQPSHWCGRCGARMCPRCGEDGSGEAELCPSCTRLFFQPEKTDRSLRLQRVNALRNREYRLARIGTAASMLVPGVAGLLAKRPMRSLIGCVLFALAAVCVFWRAGVVPDPLVAGGTAPLVFLGLAVLSTLAYALVVGTSLSTRRNEG